MRFGISFFPTVSPTEKSAYQYYEECLDLTVLAEELGFHHVKTVEHYFHPYGGYSPDPVTFLAAAAARTNRVRLVTGAAIPAFTHPIKLAGKLAMLDNISGGRLDAGFGRAFLPDEFEAFGVPIEESRRRFSEGVEACKLLWTQEDAVWDGEFYRFGPVTMLPRPCQRPHPPVMVAAAASSDSCEAAGRAGHNLQLVPSISHRERVQDMLALYRKAWVDAGHAPGTEHVQLSYTCYLAAAEAEARRGGRMSHENYTSKLAEAVSAWAHTSSAQYPGYERLAQQVTSSDFEQALRDTKILAGSPEQVRRQVAQIRDWYGDATLSLQVTSGNLPIEESARTMRLFATEVMAMFDRGD
ncbi:LLM class flavin-dependent oxidoreductase [Saccharopolyspora phatthalungensis]|uniref:Alkanesulfonate monooxygenase SsuD/methylene tetrahydromethanopterin reductase-like flavin-dependent oxidoreductase (Luciferase family) n=1 Tax=Saccharopolyspora phatthalungensis TaxID=664693 RepID=A0A840Q7Y9_9PSEU|nr:LLM class flavin-dependent oxidoreductase [Saccharopolyspora phatthalungensis]MBB5156834.1 alkanesulfonate monooxygenase SsuD/methylene tetrahydromethanopterin reductase-like flavin-dependent oxidoreductase (luciferase family) [Saccharopolyspora phatthalungensis]